MIKIEVDCLQGGYTTFCKTEDDYTFDLPISSLIVDNMNGNREIFPLANIKRIMIENDYVKESTKVIKENDGHDERLIKSIK